MALSGAVHSAQEGAGSARFFYPSPWQVLFCKRGIYFSCDQTGNFFWNSQLPGLRSLGLGPLSFSRQPDPSTSTLPPPRLSSLRGAQASWGRDIDVSKNLCQLLTCSTHLYFNEKQHSFLTVSLPCDYLSADGVLSATGSVYVNAPAGNQVLQFLLKELWSQPQAFPTHKHSLPGG